MWNQTQQARLEEIDTELKRMSGYKSHQLSDKQSAHMERLVDEGYELVAKRAPTRQHFAWLVPLHPPNTA